MNKIKLLIVGFLFTGTAVMAQNFAPAAGKPGTTAIPFDSTCFVEWAKNVEVTRGYINISDTTEKYQGSNKATFGTPENAEGPADNIATNSVSLGDSGVAIVTFTHPIKNGPGYDFAVFENGVTDNFLELGLVEVSSDGINYVRFPAISNTPVGQQIGSFSSLDPTYIYNLAGKYRKGYGTPFDLEELKDSIEIDINKITHIKIIDVIGSIGTHHTTDSQGNIINDPFPTSFDKGGFDLNGVGVIHAIGLQASISKWEKNNLKIYPNPSHGKIHVSGLTKTGNTLLIYNQLGKKIKRIRTNKGQTNFTFHLPQGFYILAIKNKKGIERRQVIIQ